MTIINPSSAGALELISATPFSAAGLTDIAIPANNFDELIIEIIRCSIATAGINGMRVGNGGTFGTTNFTYTNQVIAANGATVENSVSGSRVPLTGDGSADVRQQNSSFLVGTIHIFGPNKNSEAKRYTLQTSYLSAGASTLNITMIGGGIIPQTTYIDALRFGAGSTMGNSASTGEINVYGLKGN